jgi:hypothetical protein
VRRWLPRLAGCGLVLVGSVALLYGAYLATVRGDSPESGRLLPLWIGGSVILGALAVVWLGLWLARKDFGRRVPRPR